MTAGIVIVGAGYCGVSAAIGARDAGFDGPITVVGEEQEWPYERPQLSKWDLSGPAERPIFASDIYSEKNINLRRGDRVIAVNRDIATVSLQNGEELKYSRLLLASGAAARRVDPHIWPQVDLRYLRSLSDAKSLSEDIKTGAQVVIIGGGFIGLELASTLASIGANVHVIEAQDRVLARAVPCDISDRVHKLHNDNGVTIHTNTTIKAFSAGSAVLSNGRIIQVDHVIAGIGSIPCTELAERAGLAVQNGIVVDWHFATEDPRIFAAGDCCISPIGGAGSVRLESWQVAGDQGRRAGQIMAGASPDIAEPPWFWSDQFAHSLQVVGVADPMSSRVVRNLPNGAILIFDQGRNDQVISAAAFGQGNSIGRDVSLAKKIIASKVPIKPGVLADPRMSLKSILRNGAGQSA